MRFLRSLIKHSLQPARHLDAQTAMPLAEPIQSRADLVEESQPQEETVRNQPMLRTGPGTADAPTVVEDPYAQARLDHYQAPQEAPAIHAGSEFDPLRRQSEPTVPAPAQSAAATQQAATRAPIVQRQPTVASATDTHSGESRGDATTRAAVAAPLADAIAAPGRVAQRVELAPRQAQTNHQPDGAVPRPQPAHLDAPQTHPSRTAGSTGTIPATVHEPGPASGPRPAPAQPALPPAAAAEPSAQVTSQVGKTLEAVARKVIYPEPAEALAGASQRSREAQIPQVRIGRINVLIEDQAATRTKPKAAPAGPPAANPFGLRGL